LVAQAAQLLAEQRDPARRVGCDAAGRLGQDLRARHRGLQLRLERADPRGGRAERDVALA
jgi:hypothetical protein